VTSDGNVLRIARGDRDFDGALVSLGALGAVVRVTLDVEPAYEVRQQVFLGLAWEQLFEHFDAITASGYSVSVFTRWGESTEQVWIKSRVAAEPGTIAGGLYGALPATGEMHPIAGSIRSTARRNSVFRARGTNACPTSGRASRRAAVKRSSRNTSSRGRTRYPRSKRSGESPRRSDRCYSSARSARSRQTGCG